MKHSSILAWAVLMAFAVSIRSHAQETWDLEQCIDYAIAHNLTVKQREAARQQSEIDANTARWSRLPDLNGNASHSFNFGRSLQANNTYQSINTQSTGFGLSTSIPLFTGMQIPNNIALSKLNLQAAVADLDKAKEDVSLQVASAYLQVLFNQELANVAHEQVKLSQDLLAQKEAFFENGKASEAEWLEAKARVAQDELSAVQADNNCGLSLLELTQLLELPSPEGFRIAAPDVRMEMLAKDLAAPAEIYSQAVTAKPAILAAQYRLQGATRNIKIARSGYYPQLSFGAGLSTNIITFPGGKMPHSGHSSATTSASISDSRSASPSSTVCPPATGCVRPRWSGSRSHGNWKKQRKRSTRKYNKPITTRSTPRRSTKAAGWPTKQPKRLSV